MTDDPPLLGEGDESNDTTPQEGDGTATRASVVALWVGIVVLIGGGIFAAIVLLGDGSDAVRAIPDDVDLVVTVDLPQLTDSDRIDSLIETFAVPMEDAGYLESSEVGLTSQLDQMLQEEFDVTLEEDILPWLGRSLAVGAWIPSGVANADDVDAVVSVTIRDEEAAAGFVRSVVDPVDSAPFDDGTVYTPQDESFGEFVLWIGDDLLIMATDRATLRQALDSRDGGSLSTRDEYTQAVGELPSDRLALLWGGPSFFEAVADVSGAVPGVSMEEGPTAGIRGSAFSVSLHDVGIQFDSVQLLEDDAEQGPFAPSDGAAVVALPAETLGFLDFSLVEGQVRKWLDQYRDADPEGYDQTSSDIEAELGVDVLGKVLPSMGGEDLIAVIHSRDGVLAQETDLPLGILLSLGVMDTGPISELVTAVEEYVSAEGIEIRSGSPSVAMTEGNEFVAYQVTEDALVAGSSVSVVDQFLDGEGGLTDSDLYQELASLLPGDDLALFADMGRIFDLFDMTAEDRAIAEPIRGLGGSYRVEDDVVSGSLLILVDY